MLLNQLTPERTNNTFEMSGGSLEVLNYIVIGDDNRAYTTIFTYSGSNISSDNFDFGNVLLESGGSTCNILRCDIGWRSVCRNKCS